MTILKSIITKAKNFSTETKFNINLKKFIKEQEDDILNEEACFEKAILEGNVESAYYAWRRIASYKQYLKEKLEFETYMNSLAA